MTLRLFIIAAIVLVVFAIIAGAAASQTLFSVRWFIWGLASLLAFYVDVAVGGWGYPLAGRTRREVVVSQ